MQALSSKSKKVVVFADEVRVKTAIERLGRQVSIAAINDAKNIVISGECEAVQAILKHLKAEGIECHPLSDPHVFHSPLKEPILEVFDRIAEEVKYSTPQFSIISNLTEEIVAGQEIASAAYWQRHIREVIRFSKSMQTLHEQGYQLFVEIGPHPVLTSMERQCFPTEAGVWLPSLKREQGDWQQLLKSLETLYKHGMDVDWCGFDRDYRRHRLSLPTYPFERQRYWTDTLIGQKSGTGRVSKVLSHPFLGQRLPSPLKQIQFESQFSLDFLPLVRDHQLYGKTFVNFVIYLEIALAGAMEAFGKKVSIVKDVFISQALTLSKNEIRPVQLILEPDNSSQVTFQIFSLTNSSVDTQAAWVLHVTGKLCFEKVELASSTQTTNSFKAVQARCQKEITGAEFYQMIREKGAELGPTCQLLEHLWLRHGETLGRIRLPEDEINDTYQLPLTVIDACFQLLAASFLNLKDDYMLAGVESFHFYSRSDQRLWGRAILKLDECNETITGNLSVFDDTEKPVMEVVNAQLRRVDKEVLQRPAQSAKRTSTQSTANQLSAHSSLFREQVLNAEPGKRQMILETYLLERLANALQFPVSKLQPQQLLSSLVDSLIIVELKNQIEADLQVAVPASKFFEAISITQLVTFVSEQFNPASSNLEHVDDNTLAQALTEVEGLSEAEVQTILADET